MDDASDLLEQLESHLAAPCQAWLFGAGISKTAGIPLMIPLTARIRARGEGTPQEEVMDALFTELPNTAHIEHLLSHLSDYAALAERAKLTELSIGGRKIQSAALLDAHTNVVVWIAEAVRWGYRAAFDGKPETIGTVGNSIVNVKEHLAFVHALFSTTQAGLHDRRGPVHLFSTNYDTLLEDALALCAVPYWDGFSGGAVAFRNFHFGELAPSRDYRAHVVKLHGSIDWHLGDDGRVWRVRDGDQYPDKAARVLIHPQSTKYLATQRDPFAVQFDLFRRALSTSSDNVLAVCGYSFGDEHINQEIEFALGALDNKTTMLAFLEERSSRPEWVERWRNGAWAKRLYVVTEKGLYVGSEGPFLATADGKQRDWWTFSGVTKLLKDGTGGSL